MDDVYSKPMSVLQMSLKRVFNIRDPWTSTPTPTEVKFTVSELTQVPKEITNDSQLTRESTFIDPDEDGDSGFLRCYVIYCCNFVDSRRKRLIESESTCWDCVPSTSHSGEAIWQQDFTFIRRLATDCCLTRTSLMMGLHYFTAVSETSLISQSRHTWRMILVNCLILAEKMWEDNYIHPHYMRLRFCYHCGSRAIPSAGKFLDLQLELLKALEWKTNISDSEYHQLHESVCKVQTDPSFAVIAKTLGDARLPNRPLPAVPKMNMLPR